MGLVISVSYVNTWNHPRWETDLADMCIHIFPVYLYNHVDTGVPLLHTHLYLKVERQNISFVIYV